MDPVDLEGLYAVRASVRRFKPVPLSEGDLDKLIFAAQRAPTDATAQMYSLLRITDLGLRKALAQLAGGQEHLITAAEVFVVLADVYRLQKLVEQRGGHFANWPMGAQHFSIIDAVLAGSALATQAEALGYGICWIGGILDQVDQVVDLLELPPGVLPVAGLVVGVPDETPAPRPRLSKELLVHENRYQTYSPSALDAAFQTMRSITRRNDWYELLSHYFGEGGIMEQREGSLREAVALAGFSAEFTPATARELSESGYSARSLGELIHAALALGYRNVIFDEKGAWLEKETEAHRGDSAEPGEALAKALLTALGRASDWPFGPA